MSDYVIVDEPRPGVQERFIAHPVMPLFYFMFGITAVAWLWLAFNSHALGSSRRRREWLVLLAGFVGALGLTVIMLYLLGSGLVDKAYASYLMLALTIWKLAVTYWVVMLQYPSHELYEYLYPERSQKNLGMAIFGVLMFLAITGRNSLLGELPPWLQIALG